VSYDRQLDQVCPHFVVEEALFLDPDYQTVRPLRPISSALSVKVRLNRELEVPSVGVRRAAIAKGSKAEPFSIRGGINDRLVVSINSEPDQIFTVPAGAKASVKNLAFLLNRQNPQGFLFDVSAKKQLQLKSRREGRSATIFVRAASTAAATFGLSVDRLARGQNLAPGWSLINDPNTLNDRPTRLLVFDGRLKGFADFAELNYVTVRQECRRCGGLGVENDWRYGTDREIITVKDEALLLQEHLKIMFTVKGSNVFHTWYGTKILDAVGKKLTSGGSLQNTIVADIYETFRRWQQIKKKQEEDVGQFVSDAEFPSRLVSVSLEESDQDPTVVFVNATVQNRSDQPIQIERGLRIPEPEDILGSTAQQGVFRQSLSNFTLTE
jgi:hypothetical protein